MTYQTNNPIGSVDVRDLYDNAEAFDNFSAGPLDAYADRFGVSRQSLQGIRNASQYQVLGPYAAGLVFTSYNQVFSYGGEFYAPSAAVVLPYTTTGAGAGEIATFRSVGDAILRDDMADPTTPGKGAALVGYRGRTVTERLDDFISIKSLGVLADGSDETAAINAANAYVTGLGKTLYWPAGTYVSGAITLIENQRWVGAGMYQTTLKAKSGLNADFLSTVSANNVNGVQISHMKLDGNRANNTSGRTLLIRGANPKLTDLLVTESAEAGILTDFNEAFSPPPEGLEGTFTDIICYRCGKEGWVHIGPTDSAFINVRIIDTGLLADNTYVAFNINKNGRFFNLHLWNTGTVPAVATVGAYVNSAGNSFTNCHFEGSTLPLSVLGNANVFEACAYYAPRGTHAVSVSGAANIIKGHTGLGAFAGNPNYIGLYLIGVDNIIEVVDGNSFNGIVQFQAGEQGNKVTILGLRNTGTIIVGTPASDDFVEINVRGTAGLQLVQNPAYAWKSYTPALTANTGTFTSAIVGGRYMAVGKTIHFQCTVTITTNGTAAGSANVSLPFPSVSQTYVVGGREGLTGKALVGNIPGLSSTVRITDYANVYPGANGQVLFISGFYEAA